MITITRNGLKLTSDADVIPAQGSSNVPVSFMNDDDEYASYIVQPSIGWYTKTGKFKATLAVFENDSFDIPAEAFLQDGQIYISIGLVDPQNANHIEKTLQLSLECRPAPFGTVILPNTDTWQQLVQSFTNELFDDYTESEVDPVLSQAQQAVQTANTASSNANQALTNANQAISTANQASEDAQEATQNAESATTAANNAASAANIAAGTANSAAQNATDAAGLANTAASQAQSAAAQATEAAESVNTVLSGTDVPDASTGKNGDLYVVVGTGTSAGNVYKKTNNTWELQMSIVGPSKITLNGATQATFEAKGIGFYISDDDESITIGNYDEWVSAGSPAFPSE